MFLLTFILTSLCGLLRFITGVHKVRYREEVEDIRQHSTISELLTDKIEGLKFDSSLTLEVSKIESFLSDDRSLRFGKCR